MEHHIHELTIAQWFKILELSMHCYIKYILYLKSCFEQKYINFRILYVVSKTGNNCVII